MPFEIGQRVGDYEVQKLLGVGGMGHVYLVRNIISNRTEAMKVLLPDLTAEPDLATRFISEIRTLAGFDHPNIAQLRTAFQANNQLIMMMEFVEGYTLEQLATQRRMSVDDVANYVSQSLSALSYAHKHGVVHRDIKPANLMVTSHGIVKLMDFGIAKSETENLNHTKPGTTIGSLHYMSPEQVRGGHIDPRSDLYSVGIVLYELLAGRRPFEAETTFSILNAQINTPPQAPIEINPSLPPRLNEIILTALAKDPAARFQSADDFRAALKPFRTAPLPEEMAATGPMAALAPTEVQPVPAAASQPAAPTGSGWSQVPSPTQPPSQGAPTPLTQPLAQSYGNNPGGYPNPGSAPTQPGYAFPPPGAQARSGSNKSLWIGLGVAAVVIALAGVGFALPRFMKTNPPVTTAANTTNPNAVSSTTVTAPAEVIPTVSTPSNGTIAPTTPPNTVPTSGTYAANGSTQPSGTTTRPSGNALVSHTGHLVNPLDSGRPGQSPNGNPGPGPDTSRPPQPPANNAELESAEEQLVQVKARANTARRGVGQIRSQQEAMGLGLRGDVESAESRLDSYLNAANSDVQRGNAAAAHRDLDKADAELAILEKFLGH